jgi:hypothetical protein
VRAGGRHLRLGRTVNLPTTPSHPLNTPPHNPPSPPQVPQLVEEYMRGGTKLDDYITHEMPFESINEAFELLHSGKTLRTVLSFKD